MSIELLILLVLFSPLIGGLIEAFVRKGSGLIPSVFIGLSFAISLILLFVTDSPEFIRWEWLNSFLIGIQLDKTATILLLLVSFISLLVHVFSMVYMKEDPGVNRYFLKLGFFTFSMFGLILSDHMLLLFVFWELVGLASYLLIGFWYRKEGVPSAARMAFMVNRVADIALFAGILLLSAQVDSIFLSELSGQWFLLPSLLIAIGAFGKSAQFPFSGWLTKAMAGPTPVSALIHAATMVAAGVYLLYRVSPFLHESVMTMIAIIGAVTALYGGISAMTQNDLKKALAYSTISQLGYMVLGIGVGSAGASMFHLWTHAFFKAGLFLAAGSIIHYFHQLSENGGQAIDSQDMRRMGGLKDKLPVTFWSFSICGLALAGIPFFSGFISKEGIILSSLVWAGQKGTLAYLIPDIALLTALLTSFYIGRMFFLIFLGEPRRTIKQSQIVYSEAAAIRIPLFLLAAGSLWVFYNWNPMAHVSWVNTYFDLGSVPEGNFFSAFITLVAIFLAAGGIVLAYFLFKPGARTLRTYTTDTRSVSILGRNVFNGFYLTQSYQGLGLATYIFSKKLAWADKKIIDGFIHFFAVGTVVLAKVVDLIDKLIVDGLVNLSARIASFFGRRFSGVHSREAQWQLIWLFIGFVLILTWILFF
ncbi:MAG: NADH-quinone oxidoreductase subunit L [Cyclobacteriaceae bacterium]